METYFVIVLTTKRHRNDELQEVKTDGKFNTCGRGENCEYYDSRKARREVFAHLNQLTSKITTFNHVSLYISKR
jgi:hypothetical protein